jgi:hypothetical protein
MANWAWQKRGLKGVSHFKKEFLKEKIKLEALES